MNDPWEFPRQASVIKMRANMGEVCGNLRMFPTASSAQSDAAALSSNHLIAVAVHHWLQHGF